MQLKPKFRPELITSEQVDKDGTPLIVLNDPFSEKYFRLSLREYKFLRLFDGTRTLEEAVEAFRGMGRHYAVDDAKLILERAAQLGLMLGTNFSTARYLSQLRDTAASKETRRQLSRIYFLYIPLINPDAFLERTLRFVAFFASKWLAAVVLLLIPGAVYFVLADLPRLENEQLLFFNWKSLIYLWITIGITKLVHEFAHAYTAKHFGLRVPRMGVAFLIFFPCLYCDTTDAWQLASRKQRIAISAAGIISEAVLALLAAYVWHMSKPGVVHSLAFYLMAVSFVSTVLFNGNPLMKFDGYFILTDYLGVPNLQGKSFAYLKYLFMNRTLGMSLAPNPAGNLKELLLFAVYGISAFMYRVVLYTGIVVAVYYRFDKTVGALLAVVAFAMFVALPVVGGARSLHQERSKIRVQLRALALCVGILFVIGLLFFVPVASKSVYPCYVASAQVRKITVPLKTSVAKVMVRQWQNVTEGQLMFELDASELHLALIKKEVEQEALGLQLEMIRLDPKEMGRAESKLTELYHCRRELMRIRDDLKVAQGGITAPFSGLITSLDEKMLPGYRPGAGAVVGELQSHQERVAHALVPEQDRNKMRAGHSATVWMPSGSGWSFKGTIESVKPYQERDLKGSPFSSRLGGELVTEVKGERVLDAPLVAQYKCSVSLKNEGTAIPLGMVGLLTIESPPTSLFSRFSSRLLKTTRVESLM